MEYYFGIMHEHYVVPLEQAEAESNELWEKQDYKEHSKYPFIYGSMCMKYRGLYNQFKELEAAYKELKNK